MKDKHFVCFTYILLTVIILLTHACAKESAGEKNSSAASTKDIAIYKRYAREALPDSLTNKVTAIRNHAIETGDYETWGISALILANRSARTQDYASGIAEMENYLEHVTAAVTTPDILYQAYYRTGEFYYVNGFQNIALDYFLNAANHATTEKEKCRIHYAIGISSTNIHEASAGIDPNKYFLMAEDLAKQTNDSAVVAQALFGRAGTYFDFLGVHKIKDRPLSPSLADSINTAMTLLSEAEDYIDGMAVLDYAIGLSYAGIKDFDRAKYHIDRGISADHPDSPTARSVRASLLICMGQYKEAEAIARDAFEKARKTSNETDMRNALHILYYTYKYSGNTAKALDAFESFSEKRQKLMDESFERQVNIAQVRFDTKLKEEQLLSTEKENSLYRKGLLMIGCAFLIVMTLLLVIVFYYRKLHKAHQILVQKSLQWAQEPIGLPPTDNGRSDTERRAVLEQLNDLMSSEKLYLRPDLTINEVANALQINRTYLSDAINRIHERSFTLYINELRTRHAINLISDPASDQYTVDALAQMTGFSNRKTFHSAFVKVTGLTPSEFRRNRNTTNIL